MENTETPTRKRGRPFAPPAQRRKNHGIGFTDSEYAELQQQAEQAEQSLGQYIASQLKLAKPKKATA